MEKTSLNISLRAGVLGLFALGLWISSISAAQELRYVDPAFDIQNLPASGTALSAGGTDAQIVRFRNWASLYPTREIRAGSYQLELPRNEVDFSDLRYTVADQSFSIEDFMLHNHVGGLLVIKNGSIKLERYGLGNTEDSLWVSYSMSKSATSMLLGAAIQDGYIASVDDMVTDYLPRLKGSSYDEVSLKDVLQMASGVEWDEDYADPNSDVATYPSGEVIELLRFLGNKERVAEPGDVFNYNTGETDLVGAIVRAAIGNNLASYIENKIWQPFGMESDANWATHGNGGERGGCCMNATLRDYGRIGMFAMNGGVLADGTRVVPQGWMQESTTSSKGNAGYGYLWWLLEGPAFQAIGIYGQGIYINPETETVIAVLSAWTTATGREYSAHRAALYRAIDEILAEF
ncbi:MAG: serine hydrolase [Proteobacteria bacterium]|nr:serine hydrolase [Pseudomonadota bacterium]